MYALQFGVPYPIALMMETAGLRTSETSVNFNVTARRYIPEDSELHIRRRENLKSHKFLTYFLSTTANTAIMTDFPDSTVCFQLQSNFFTYVKSFVQQLLIDK
jgi:hypothetical protein